LAQADGEQRVRRLEGNSLALSGSREFGLAVGVEDHGVGEAVLQVGDGLAQVVVLLPEAVEGVLRGVALDGAGGGMGLAVDGLAASAALVGQAGDSAVGAGKDGGRTGELLVRG
jgi:hypothetical protein